MRILRLLLICVLFGPLLLQPRAAASAQGPPEVKVTNLSRIASVEGKDNYQAYCAVCHGRDGKGDGPAAPALKGPLPDLTRLVDSSGKFRFIAVHNSIVGRDRRPLAHGTLDMPPWGPLFTSADASQAISEMRIKNLTEYLESIQQH